MASPTRLPRRPLRRSFLEIPSLRPLGFSLCLGLVAWGTSACRVEVTLPNQDSASVTAPAATPAPTAATPDAPPAPAAAAPVDDTPTLGSDGRLTPSTRFQGQPFDAAAYGQIPRWGTGCAQYGLGSICEYQRDYAFADGTLTVMVSGTEGAGATFAFQTPVPLAIAQDYGRILSRGVMSLDQITSQDNTQVMYEDLEPSGSGSFVILDLNPDGQVRAVNFGEWSP